MKSVKRRARFVHVLCMFKDDQDAEQQRSAVAKRPDGALNGVVATFCIVDFAVIPWT